MSNPAPTNQLPKIPEAEARKFLRETDPTAFPTLYATVKHWIDSKDTGYPVYTIKWNRRNK
jgi:effector-binding domain-containing protein